MALPTRLDDRAISYPIMAKEPPANLGTSERGMQDTTVQPTIAGPSKHREPMAEIAPPYHMEAPRENASDTVEGSSLQVAPHPPPMHSDPETGASVASQSSSSANTSRERRRGGGGGGDDGGESEDDTHERDREWERERARRAGE